MRQSRYLESVLTVIAVLLVALVWTQVAERPVVREATAQSADPVRFPNASELRLEGVKRLTAIEKEMKELRKYIREGKLEVTVTNLDEIEIEVPAEDPAGG